jgi:hypothetical protein
MEATMGGLINTKGTQRLAEWFNKTFDDSATGLSFARTVSNGTDTLPGAFKKAGNSLLDISDAFIAQQQHAGSTWPAGGNDVLYPSATMQITSVVTTTPPVLRFTLPAGISTRPTFIVAPSGATPGSAVSCTIKTGRKKMLRGTTVTAVTAPTGAPATFDVTVSNPTSAAPGDFVTFALGSHQMLVRRWRWYLKNDLRAENDTAIQDAISSALSDGDFKKITFQAIEDTQQKVITSTETRLGTDFEFDDAYHLHIVLMTQQTTAPDPLDPQ